ncbi:MAG TPA: diaminopimelate epimerase [Abditibacteriaceae bacterium]|jgi:diaminopimelate epimerase
MQFTKMHGLGNDFVVLDSVATPLDIDFSAFAIASCDRHFGIGGDGLLLLEKSECADVRMRMWNPDGTEDMCGNGLRCVAMLAHQRCYVSDDFQVETLAGIRSARIDGDSVRVSMGAPSWEFNQIPMQAEKFSPHEYDLAINGKNYRASSLSTGSTHTILWCDTLPDDIEFFAVSSQVEVHELFIERTSVLWAHVAKGEIALRIWERGVGETLACGTGACAAAVTAMDTQRSARGAVGVKSKGGVLQIEWGNEIYKTGPAQIAFEGNWP